MQSTIRKLLNLSMSEISGFAVIILVSIVGLSIFFGEQHPNRWYVLVLLLALLGLEIYSNYNDWWYESVLARHGLLVIKASIISALMLIPPQSGVFIILFFILAVEAPLWFEQRTWIAWIAILTILSAVLLVIQSGWEEGILQTLLYSGAYLFFASFALTTRRAEEARRESQRLLAELRDAHSQLQAYADQVEELTIADERNRLAREMHDTVGHRLTVSAVQLEAAQRLISTDPQRAADMVGTVHTQVQEALGELRQTVAALRAPLEEDLSLATSMQRLVQQFQSGTGIQVELDLPDALPDLPPAHRKALYRAAQESLTNVQRHAGAKNVWMQLQSDDTSIALHVGDDGVGVPPHVESSGFGLRGLRERAAQLGGDFHLAPRPGGGSQATFHVPLPDSNQEPENR